MSIGATAVPAIARHGVPHSLPPHRINYRANIAALSSIGVTSVIGLNTVGIVTSICAPGEIGVPDQIIDYTWGREHTFFTGGQAGVEHIEFTEPFDGPLRGELLEAARRADVQCRDGGVYAATQGPRLETAAEVDRLERDGADYVGMTGMPEAALARELEVEYATCAVIVNWAAGKSAGIITMDTIRQHLAAGMATVKRLLENSVTEL